MTGKDRHLHDVFLIAAGSAALLAVHLRLRWLGGRRLRDDRGFQGRLPFGYQPPFGFEPDRLIAALGLAGFGPQLARALRDLALARVGVCYGCGSDKG